MLGKEREGNVWATRQAGRGDGRERVRIGEQWNKGKCGGNLRPRSTGMGWTGWRRRLWSSSGSVLSFGLPLLASRELRALNRPYP